MIVIRPIAARGSTNFITPTNRLYRRPTDSIGLPGRTFSVTGRRPGRCVADGSAPGSMSRSRATPLHHARPEAVMHVQDADRLAVLGNEQAGEGLVGRVHHVQGLGGQGAGSDRAGISGHDLRDRPT